MILLTSSRIFQSFEKQTEERNYWLILTRDFFLFLKRGTIGVKLRLPTHFGLGELRWNFIYLRSSRLNSSAWSIELKISHVFFVY